MTLNRDVYIAIFLLLASGALMMASFEIREPDYGQLSPATWPRVIIGVIAALSAIFLLQSLRKGPDAPREGGPTGLSETISYWRNVLWVFFLFLAYLLAIPYVGMLIGGVAFAFSLLSVLGGLRNSLLHGAIALIAVGGMWALFTFVLDVLLPRGEWTGI